MPGLRGQGAIGPNLVLASGRNRGGETTQERHRFEHDFGLTGVVGLRQAIANLARRGPGQALVGKCRAVSALPVAPTASSRVNV